MSKTFVLRPTVRLAVLCRNVSRFWAQSATLRRHGFGDKRVGRLGMHALLLHMHRAVGTLMPCCFAEHGQGYDLESLCYFPDVFM